MKNPLRNITIENTLARLATWAPTVETVGRDPDAVSGEAKIFYGGDVVLARRMHWRVREVEQFGDIPSMRDADMRIVNLECVVSSLGEQGTDKGESASFYYHARPEMLNVLTNAGIDVVLTANNHAGDYGRDALVDQNRLLDQAGIIHAGSGNNLDDASKPIYVHVNDLVIALLNFDMITKNFGADDTHSGTWYVSPSQTDQWRDIFSARIVDARRHADLVFVAPHWGNNDATEPLEYQKTLGRLLIDLGADAVLGCHAHVLQGVENYKGRPIVYDAGNFLFDTRYFPRGADGVDTGGFLLTVDRNGVRSINFTPLRNGFGFVKIDARHRDRINKNFVEMCRALDTAAAINDDGTVDIAFDPAPRGVVHKEEPSTLIDPLTIERRLIEPLSEPRPEWTVERVPDEAIIRSVHFGPIKMVGYRIPPEYRTLKKRGIIYVETYWTIDQPVPSDCRLQITIKPIRECRVASYNTETDHDFCDWMFPVNRWTPGVIYRDRFGVYPPALNRMANVDFQVEIHVKIDGADCETFIDPQPIDMEISELPIYRKDFSDIIYHSEPDKCWTAEQLAAVTGGKWVIEPPKDFYIQSILRDIKFYNQVEHPTMFVAQRGAMTNFHVGRDPKAAKWDNHPQIVQYTNKVACAMIDHPVEGLPKDFPLLMVDDTIKACMELALAARKRFQGKVIAITGSAGKTTTTYMLRHVLGQDHDVIASYGSLNMFLSVPVIFDNVNQNAAFAIIEMAFGDALIARRGSLTYDLLPHIAVVTSITLAHSGSGNSTMKDIATWKALIFNGMSAGGYAILNRDMPHYDIFEQKALSKNLNIITFGMHPDSTIRMTEIKNGGSFTFGGRNYTLECPVPSEQLYDALAVVGVSIASGISIEYALKHLKTFTPVKGRGSVIETEYNGRKLHVIDSAYNANVASMSSALKYLTELESEASRRVAILGDIAELGANEIAHHRSLAEAVLSTQADRVLLVGSLMKHLYDDIKEKINGAWFPTYKELIAGVDAWLRDGDTVLLKSSNATGLTRAVEHLIG